jgi:hypothetical protein
MKKYLGYYEIHVSDQTFIEHVIVEAPSLNEAFVAMEGTDSSGETYERSFKGVLGEFTPELAFKFMEAKREAVTYNEDGIEIFSVDNFSMGPSLLEAANV